MPFSATFAAAASAAVLLLAALPPARATFIDNLVPRRDSTGAIMDSHDFSIHKYPGTSGYTMVSIGYGLCEEPKGLGCDSTPDHCGFQPNHTINVWSSPDLSSGSWTFVTTAVSVDNRPPGTIYRPDAIWNPHTNSVVLWYNWLNAAGQYEGYAAYTAPTPAGPYTRVRESVNVTMQNATSNCGDFHLFVDPQDGTPYLIAGCQFHMWIERLNPNMLDSAGDTSATGLYMFDEYFIEAPALFFRNGLYYAIFGHCCCYCFQGSGAIVHTAPHPLGPWTSLGDVACIPTPPPAPVQCGSAAENSVLELGCAGGATIAAVSFASFGTPTGSCAAGWAVGACNAANSTSAIAALCVGRASCSVEASTAFFGDPCLGTLKSLAASVTCSAASGSMSTPAASRGEAFLAAIGASSSAPLASVGAEPTPGQGCQYVNASTTSALRSQQSDIFEVDLAGGGTAWVWAGDRWEQSWDGLKGHDPQLWVPIVFNDDGSGACSAQTARRFARVRARRLRALTSRLSLAPAQSRRCAGSTTSRCQSSRATEACNQKLRSRAVSAPRADAFEAPPATTINEVSLGPGDDSRAPFAVL